MYKPNKRLLDSGLIVNRPDYFFLKGYEYTFNISSHEELAARIKERFDQAGIPGMGYKIHENKPVIVAICSGSWKYEFYRNGFLESDHTYTGFFSRWEMYPARTRFIDEMNRLLTCLETMFCSIDPLAWIRELPMKRQVINGIGSTPEIWDADPPDRDLTREAAAEKKLEEMYLADRLRGYGMDIFGGTPYAETIPPYEHPTIVKRIERNIQKEKEKKEEEERKANAPAPKKFCYMCGREILPKSRFCAGCGTPVKKTIEEKMAEEVTLKRYPFFFICEPCEDSNPYLYVNFDEYGNIVPEKDDAGFTSLEVKSLQLTSMPKGAQKYSLEYSSENNEETELVFTDSRLIVINREYNKNNAGTFTGIGGLTAMAIGAAITAGGRAIMAKKRGQSVLAGQLRYEWLAGIYYKRKQKMLENESLRLIYMDLNRTKWSLTIYFEKGTDTALLANDILRRAALLRSRMLDEREEKINSFLENYKDGRSLIPVSSDPERMSGVSFPEFFCATKGMPFKPE